MNSPEFLDERCELPEINRRAFDDQPALRPDVELLEHALRAAPLKCDLLLLALHLGQMVSPLDQRLFFVVELLVLLVLLTGPRACIRVRGRPATHPRRRWSRNGGGGGNGSGSGGAAGARHRPHGGVDRMTRGGCGELGHILAREDGHPVLLVDGITGCVPRRRGVPPRARGVVAHGVVATRSRRCA
jgi:hypothetical protein